MTDRLSELQEIFARPMVARLVSPNDFDGRGEVPDKVNAAAKQIAHLWVKFVSQWDPAMPNPLTAKEVEQLFTATAIQSEWMRELHEAVHESLVTIASLREDNEKLRVERDGWEAAAHLWKRRLVDEQTRLRGIIKATRESLTAERDALRAVVAAADERRAKGAPAHPVWRDYDEARAVLAALEGSNDD